MLTARKKAFVDNYLSTLNASEAARKAGYSTHTAHSIGSRLLKDVDVKPLIDQAIENERGKLSRESFTQLAYQDYQKVSVDSPQRPRFLEIAGKALGYLNGDSAETNKDIQIVILNTIVGQTT